MALVTRVVAMVVALHGAVLIAGTLSSQLMLHSLSISITGVQFNVYVTLLIGMSLLYLSLLLSRRKQTAWLLSFSLYALILGIDIERYQRTIITAGWRISLVSVFLAVVMLLLLWLTRKEFVVRSDIRTFTSTLRVAVVVLATALLYGTGGYMLMDTHDFHQEITAVDAAHYTIDQFGLTVNTLEPHTRRAALFQDSLMFISMSACAMVLASLFQPIRARYAHRQEDLEHMRGLVYDAAADSEDFFKLWPRDKMYLFSKNGHAGIAYKVRSGAAIAASSPVGASSAATNVVRSFDELCMVNDWTPAFMHITDEWQRQLARHGYRTQLIGQEAVVDVGQFTSVTIHSKYFREINRRFDKLAFETELLTPPHNAAIIDRLQAISEEWLRRPGRVERGFMMGYFSAEYMQQCRLIVARDAAGTIQGFINLVPSPVLSEANIDLFRSSERAPGNMNDYLIVKLLMQLRDEGVTHLNLGLCPLSGLDEAPSTLVNRALHFAYANGDMLYSFKGLHRFKAKYEPVWRNRYVAYRGNLGDLIKIMRAFARATKI